MTKNEWFCVGLLIAGAVFGTVVQIDPAVPIGLLIMAVLIVRTA